MFEKRFKFFLLLLTLVFSSLAAAPQGRLTQVDLKARAKALLAEQLDVSVDSLQLVGRGARIKYPFQALTVYAYKFIDAQGTTYSMAVTEDGQRADIETLDGIEAAAYETRFGKLDRRLVQAISNSNPGDLVEVDIWLKMPDVQVEEVLGKPEVNGSLYRQEFTNREDGVKAAEMNQKTYFNSDLGKWDALEAAHSKQVISQVEAVMVPFTTNLRALGYETSTGSLAPMVNVKLPVKMIRAYAKSEQVEGIYLGAQSLGQEINIARQVIGANTVNTRGFTGTGSKVAVVEYAGMVSSTNPYLTGITRDNLYNCPVDWHVTGIAGEIRSTHSTYKGIAPSTSLWVGCGWENVELQKMTNRANTWGADTYSLSWYSSVGLVPTAMDRFFDTIMFSHRDLVIKSAGNRGTSDGWVTPPGLGYNTLTVGSFDDMNTVSTAGDTMASYSSYVDPKSSHGDREKPEVAAPGSSIISTLTASPWVGDTGSGTSFAAPIVAGITSLMYQRNVELKAWPESTKAIIMATAIRNKEGASRLSEKDGAGGVWAPGADYVARNNTIYGRWGGASYTCAKATNWNIATMYLYAGRKVRVVIVWDQNPTYTYYTTKPSADLDLQVYRNNILITSSASLDNTYEIVEFTPTVTDTYNIQVDKTRCSLTPAYIGWAWFQP